MPVSTTYFCVQCGAHAAVVRHPYADEQDGKLLVVRDVPMHECDSCAEAYMSTEVVKQLDIILADLSSAAADKAIVRFPGCVPRAMKRHTRLPRPGFTPWRPYVHCARLHQYQSACPGCHRHISPPRPSNFTARRHLRPSPLLNAWTLRLRLGPTRGPASHRRHPAAPP